MFSHPNRKNMFFVDADKTKNINYKTLWQQFIWKRKKENKKERTEREKRRKRERKKETRKERKI